MTNYIQIEIKNFRYLQFASFQLEVGKITLLKGQNGAGKSTILSAVEWGLYGKTRKITPHKNEKINVQIKLLFPQIYIVRQKNPEMLNVSTSQGNFTGDIAQSIILQYFGIQLFWKTACYIKQKNNNNFFSLTTAEKLTVLNSVAFNQDNPSQEIAKIDQMLVASTNYLESLRCNYSISKKGFDQQYGTINFEQIKQYLLTNEEIAKINEDKNRILQEKMYLENCQQQRILKLQLKKDYTNQLEQSQEQIRILQVNLKKPTYLEDKKTEDVIKELTLQISQIEKKNYLKEEIDSLLELYVDDTVTEELYKSVMKQEEIYCREQQFLQKLQIKSEKISQEIENYYKAIKWGEYLNYSSIFKEQNEQKQEWERQISELHLSELEKEYEELLKVENSMLCPYCEEVVTYNEGKLKKNNISKDFLEKNCDISEKLNLLRTQINLSRTKFNFLQQKLVATENILLKLEKVEKCDLQTTNLSKEDVSFLENFTFTSSPKIKSSELLNHLQKKKLVQKLPQLQNEYEKIQITSNLSLSTLKERLYETNEYHRLSEIEYLKQNTLIEKITNDLKNLIIEEDSTEKLNQLNIKHQQYEYQLQWHFHTFKIQEYLSYLQQQEILINEWGQKVAAFRELKLNAVNAEFLTLSELAQGINKVIDQVCSNMFKRDIIVNLNMFREVKSTHVIKPEPNLSIVYKNFHYENIDDISGGETDRISLALTLALHRLNNCPLLMMDESLNSIDSIIQEQALKAISQNVNSAVLIIAHGMIEGDFDNVIDLDSLVENGVVKIFTV